MLVGNLRTPLYSLLLSCLLLPAVVLAGPTFVSPAGTVAVVELFTSEGCSSCPPADAALRQLPDHVVNNRLVAPLAFHVDYWDYIGWQDPYASSTYTARQRSYSRLWHSRTVYTPQFVVQGQQTPHGADLLSRINPVIQQAAPLRIAASFGNSDKTNVDVQISLQQLRDNSITDDRVIYVALYENNLSSQVTRGENTGRTLQHDFVVRRLSGPFKVTSRPGDSLDLSLPLQASWKGQDLGLVVFVQDQQSGGIVQALHVTAAEFPL
jgi:hypothetical protein